MITKLEIENFKCFGDRVVIPIRPITLLFGANSAGKSSILQAIHYAREVLVNHNLDVTKTENGGDWVDLGGFCNFIHKRDLNRVIRLKFYFDIDPLMSFYEIQCILEKTDFDFDSEDTGNSFNFHQSMGEYSTCGCDDTFASIEIAVAWSPKLNKPYVQEYVLETSDGMDSFVKLAKIFYEPGKPKPLLTEINPDNPTFHLKISNYETHEYIGNINWADQLFRAILGDIDYRSESRPISIGNQSDALPDENFWISNDAWFIEEENRSEKQITAARLLSSLFSVCFKEIRKDLVHNLNSLCYIGPFRESPSRAHLYNHQIKNSDWASGLAAWDALSQDGDKMVEIYGDVSYRLIDEVSKWMKRLGTGYGIISDETLELSTSEPLYLLLKEGNLFDCEPDVIANMLNNLPINKKIYLVDESTTEKFLPDDIGQGVSQVLPIIVAILRNSHSEVIVEQPELHIHPRIQAELGDLFICGKDMTSVIIETHSEHLILRMLRRIRETNAGTLQDQRCSLIPKDIAVLYVDKNSTEEINRVYEIKIDDKGEFLVPWPDTFFEQDFIERFSS